MMLALVMFMFCSAISAQVTPIPGENLWRLVASLAPALDPIQSNVEQLLSEVDVIASDVDALVVDFISVADLLTSQVDVIAQGSLLDSLEADLLSVSDVLTSALEIIDNDIASMQDFLGSKLDENSSLLEILVSEAEKIDQDIASAEESILSALDALGDCLVGVPLHQSDFAAATLTISVPGVYQLCEDITSTFNPAINVTTSNVQIDLNGHTMTVDTSGASGITVSGQSNIQIKNGTIVTTLGTAIVINSTAQNINIEDIQTFQGGISVTSSQGITIARYRGMGVGSGISLLSNSADIIVQDSSVVGSAAAGTPVNGFMINNVSNVLCDNCQALTTGIGFFITTNALGVLLRDCYATTANAGFNCTALSSSGFTMERCNAENCNFGFFVDSTVAGGEFVECIGSNGTFGFALRGNTLLLKRCVATNNITGIDITATAFNIQILDTCSVNNTTNIHDLGTNTTVINLGTVEDILLSAIDSISSCVCSVTDNIQSIFDAISDQATSIVDHIFSGSDSLNTCLVGTAVTNASLPLMITLPGVYTVCEPLVHNGTPAITIAANNVVLNFNGYTLTTNNNGVVCSGQSNVQIKNGTIQSGLEAISFEALSQSITISDMTIYQAPDVGIFIAASFGVVIERCVLYGNNGTITGNMNPGAIYLSASGSVLVKDCIVSGSVTAGIPLRGICIIEAGAGGVELQNCSVNNTTAEAFRISSAVGGNLDNVILKDCSATESGDGFLITNTSGSSFGPILDHCIAESNTGMGIGRGFVVNNIAGTTLINCSAASNGDRGFLFTTSTDQIAALLCLSHNNLIGFEIDGTKATLRWCTASNNATIGFNIGSVASNAVIDGCLASGNGSSGVIDASLPTNPNYVVDTRSQDLANPPLNPAYNLNGAPDSKASATVIRIS
jgi:parallel beta helix pectate lyase-like protein